MFRFIENWMRSFVNEMVDKTVTRIVRDAYTENLAEMFPTMQKVGGIHLMETAMRAHSGLPLSRPLGSPIHFSPWEKLLFNPVHLDRFPTPENLPIDTAVTLGRRSKKPLTVAIPLLIAAMSFGGALSKSAKIALAKGASAVGTATNTGEAGLMEEEREAARFLIGQYNRGGWLNHRDLYRRLDAVEIQLGQGAQGSAPQRTPASKIREDFRQVFHLDEGEDALIHSRLPEVNRKEEFIALVRRLREETGVPVGLKLAATHYLERELAIAVEAGVDFITLDGAEGGTHGGAPTLQDDVGLPTLFAVSRAADFLKRKGLFREISLIAAGGLITPGQMLKAMALGADAVYIGTVALMALVSDLAVESLPLEPPTSLLVYNGKLTDQLDIEKGAGNLIRFLNSAVREMELVAASLGRTSLSHIDKTDLVSLDPFLSLATGVEWGWLSSARQKEFPGWVMEYPFKPMPKPMPGIPEIHDVEEEERFTPFMDRFSAPQERGS